MLKPKILFKLTTRNRPLEAKKTINSILANVSDNNYVITATIDDDDTNIEEYKKIFVDQNIIFYLGPNVKTKVNAINKDLEKILLLEWDILVNLSDDQVFVYKNFDREIRQQFAANYNQFLHFPDGNQKKLCTMTIVGRNYFQRDAFIYHKSYKTQFCDNEAQDIAKLRKCYKFIDKQIFDHRHPSFYKSSIDSLYIKNKQFKHQDMHNYFRRKKNNYYNQYDVCDLNILFSKS